MSNLNKNQLNSALANLTQSEEDDFNNESGNNLVFLSTPGSGSGYSTEDLVNSVDALSDSDYFWLEENATGFSIAGKRSSRPC